MMDLRVKYSGLKIDFERIDAHYPAYQAYPPSRSYCSSKHPDLLRYSRSHSCSIS